jgi:hypothetical protein
MGAPKNPPAFPCETDPDNEGFQSGSQLWTHPGMTLRDWFAGRALTGLIAEHANPQSCGSGGWTAERHAGWAYELADAMLREREKGGDA